MHLIRTLEQRGVPDANTHRWLQGVLKRLDGDAQPLKRKPAKVRAPCIGSASMVGQ
jgi:hypothetical protein